ncbi:hypothetical protein LguiA_016249 [Lonicera macranthoides]
METLNTTRSEDRGPSPKNGHVRTKASFVEALKGHSSSEDGGLHFKESLQVDMDKITISPPSDFYSRYNVDNGWRLEIEGGYSVDDGWRAKVVLRVEIGSGGHGGDDRDSSYGADVVPNSDKVKSRAEGGGDCEEVEVGFVGSECEVV